jgi:P27 family predicted phage terminase small subunit
MLELLGGVAPMRGRKPIPTCVKLLRGNPGKRPLNEGEPQPAPLAPACPSELSQGAKDEWNRIIAELVQLGLMTTLDRAALATYCQAYAMWSDAIQAVQKFGPVVKSPNGYPLISPYFAIANKQAEIMIRIASEFGFTPASRSRISTGEPSALPLFETLEHNADSEQ